MRQRQQARGRDAGGGRRLLRVHERQECSELDETLSITAWEKTHPTEMAACDKEFGVEMIAGRWAGTRGRTSIARPPVHGYDSRMTKPFTVTAVWDPDAEVFTTKSDIPGLVVEAATFEELVDLVRSLALRGHCGERPRRADAL